MCFSKVEAPQPFISRTVALQVMVQLLLREEPLLAGLMRAREWLHMRVCMVNVFPQRDFFPKCGTAGRAAVLRAACMGAQMVL